MRVARHTHVQTSPSVRIGLDVRAKCVTGLPYNLAIGPDRCVAAAISWKLPPLADPQPRSIFALSAVLASRCCPFSPGLNVAMHPLALLPVQLLQDLYKDGLPSGPGSRFVRRSGSAASGESIEVIFVAVSVLKHHLFS